MTGMTLYQLQETILNVICTMVIVLRLFFFMPLTVLTRHPKAPSGVTVGTVTANSISLSWNPVAYREGIQSYKVYRDGVSVGTTNETAFTDSELSPSTQYSYQVTAVGNDGAESLKSAVVTAETSAADQTT
ncbi:fibronectin type III domain-containing protein [Bacillus licheniformis]|uniref:fibronectin type III domain-containing protein n=2 Tax=Bacillus licheniformis TaxID=1402 RepID=UPI0008FB20D8